MTLTKGLEVTSLNTDYYIIQKNIGSNWEERGRFTEEKKALEECQKLIDGEISKNNKFIYRIIRITELKLFKSTEKKPDSMLDAF